MSHELPLRAEMVRAFLEKDRSFEGIFFAAVRSTGIFCRIGCPARAPHEHQLEFFATTRDALFAGYRPCKRCRPIDPTGAPPQWLSTLLKALESSPADRWSDADIRALNIDPDRVRRWFQQHHGMTFHAYARARRLGHALKYIQKGTPIIAADRKSTRLNSSH